MSSRKRTPASPPVSPDQGAFFGVEIRSNGATDPADFATNAKIVIPQDGEPYFPPVEENGKLTQGTVDAVRAGIAAEALKTANRRAGNAGKHSAEHPKTGSYADGLRLGAFLPGFGPVMERNREEAIAYARKLDTQNAAKVAQNPTLPEDGDPAQPRPVAELVAGVAEALSIPDDTQASEQNDPEENKPPLLDHGLKIEFLLRDEKVHFMPTTHDEKNTATSILAQMTEHPNSGARRHLEETYQNLIKQYLQQNDESAKKVSFSEIQERARTGVSSRVHEIGDYFGAAKRDGNALAWASSIMDETPNPDISLKEMLEDVGVEDSEMSFDAVVALIRYNDLMQARYQKDLPMMTQREEETTGLPLQKRKIVTDPYRAAFTPNEASSIVQERHDVLREHILQQYENLTVRELRKLVPQALEDQRNRYRFWGGVLRQVGDEYQDVAELYLPS